VQKLKEGSATGKYRWHQMPTKTWDGKRWAGVEGKMGSLEGRRLYKINVRLDEEDEEGQTRVVTVKETQIDDFFFERRTYFRNSFPLLLAYALTAHRCQGATIEGLVVVDVRRAFAPGLMYGILSRVKCRDQLRIVGELKAEMFKPILIPF